jgi:hypothetical protein
MMIERPPDLLITDLYWHRPSETLEVADVLTKP